MQSVVDWSPAENSQVCIVLGLHMMQDHTPLVLPFQEMLQTSWELVTQQMRVTADDKSIMVCALLCRNIISR